MIMPHELDVDEVGFYLDAIKTDEHSGGLDMVSSMILDGLMELWVWNEDDTILVCVTRIVSYPDGYRELLVQMMAGTNVTATMSHKEIHSSLMSYALRNGCMRMSAFMRPQIWSALKDRLTGYQEEYVQISLYPEDI